MKIAETKRLILRQITPADAPFIQALYNTKPFINNIGNKGLSSLAKSKNYIETGPNAMYNKYGHGLWLVEQREVSPTAIGICGILRRDWLPEPDLGYALAPEFEGKGYAFEAAEATIAWVGKNLKSKKLLAITSQNNQRSIRLLDRLGFRFSDIVQDPDSRSALQCYDFALSE